MLWCNCKLQSKPEQGPKRDSEAHLHVELDEGDGGVRGGALWQGKRLSYVVALDLEPLK